MVFELGTSKRDFFGLLGGLERRSHQDVRWWYENFVRGPSGFPRPVRSEET
ncbi:hypothetical protein AVEN_125831-1, partial [Araneus ventricosus]